MKGFAFRTWQTGGEENRNTPAECPIWLREPNVKGEQRPPAPEELKASSGCAGRKPRTVMRAYYAAVATVAAGLLLDTAGASAGVVTGPIAGPPGAVATTVFDPAEVGYTVSEHFLEGTATAYVPTALLETDGHWSVVPSDSAPYKTRIVTYRPADPANFNGTVYVEWLNVTVGQDFAADWLFVHTEVLHQGAAYVFVSAQKVGVDAASRAIPARYGSLTHPGDSFSYDIFSQAGQAIRDDAAALLGGLSPNRLIAVGESQSAGRLVTYVNAVQPLARVYNGFLIHSRGGVGAPLSQAPQDLVTTPVGTRLRDDQVPLLVFQAETDEFRNAPNSILQPDSALYRVWDVAGNSHADSYLLGVSFTDTGDRFDTATQVFESMLNPSAQTILGLCAAPINSGPGHYALEAAVANLNRWVTSRKAPASAPRFEYTSLSPVTFAFDTNGNVLGGVRTPFVDVPIAQLSGLPAPGSPGLCILFGSTRPFTESELAGLYDSQGDYVEKFRAAANRAKLAGWIKPEQFAPLVNSAKQVPIP